MISRSIISSHCGRLWTSPNTDYGGPFAELLERELGGFAPGSEAERQPFQEIEIFESAVSSPLLDHRGNSPLTLDF